MATSATRSVKAAPPASPSPAPRNGRDFHLRRVALAIGDVILVCLSSAVVFSIHLVPSSAIRAQGLRAIVGFDSFPEHALTTLIYATLIVLACDAKGLYDDAIIQSTVSEFVSLTRATLEASVLTASAIYFINEKVISRFVVGFSAVLALVVLLMANAVRRAALRRKIRKGLFRVNALIVGAGALGQSLASTLNAQWQLGYQFKGFVDDEAGRGDALGTIADLPRVCREQFIDEVFIAIPADRELIQRIGFNARMCRFGVKVIPEMFEEMMFRPKFEYVGNFPVMTLPMGPRATLGLAVKRVIDIAGAASCLLFTAPLLMLSALLVRLESAGPVFYRSRRIGRKGAEFTCYKLRTMIKDADSLRKDLEHLNERDGVLFKIADDPRITRVGKWLRKYSIDELPQLWNVLKGDMSLVGPRPALPVEVQQYRLEHLHRLDVQPGLTGLWQVAGRTDPSFDNYVALDLEYIDNWSLALDFQILLRTLKVVAEGSGR